MASGVNAWSKQTEERVGWYVYALKDPRNGALFYIGKGKGNRAFNHARDALESKGKSSEKLDVIRAIQTETGSDPEIVLIRHQLLSESVALEIEAALLDYSNYVGAAGDAFGQTQSLTNIAGGLHSKAVGLMTFEALEALYSAKPLHQQDFPLPAIAFRIPRLWTPSMSPEELYEATHGWWRLGPRRNGARYALSVSRGVIRGIYSIEPSSWRLRGEGDREWEPNEKPRWGFEGVSVATEFNEYMNRDISSWFKQGNASPFGYINC